MGRGLEKVGFGFGRVEVVRVRFGSSFRRFWNWFVVVSISLFFRWVCLVWFSFIFWV